MEHYSEGINCCQCEKRITNEPEQDEPEQGLIYAEAGSVVRPFYAIRMEDGWWCLSCYVSRFTPAREEFIETR